MRNILGLIASLLLELDGAYNISCQTDWYHLLQKEILCYIYVYFKVATKRVSTRKSVYSLICV